MNLLSSIQSKTKESIKQLAILIDPEKISSFELKEWTYIIDREKPDYIFVGGSQLQKSVVDAISIMKQVTNIPILLFPGNAMQLSDNADALLLLSLISGRNPDLLIGQHVVAARSIKRSGVEVIPTAYILIDGGKETAVSRISGTQPLSISDTRLIEDTALAGELMGKQLIYLEAGSGASKSVPCNIISQVKSQLSIPLVVGGGICSVESMIERFDAGADIVVIGNHFEYHPEDLHHFCEALHHYE